VSGPARLGDGGREGAGDGPAPALRIGLGLDAHRFAHDRALVLGGIRLRERDGLLGHSDADVLVHALMDALLGAAGLEDIGHLFPDDDPAWAGADSVGLLRRVMARLGEDGWRVGNVDVVVVCEEPRLAPYRAEMRRILAESLGVEVGQVGLRGTTFEGMGFTGHGEGIMAQAVALLLRG
jgi:2-C-methyl-D-erythritol 2,4-cyclodiphosphate synthase